MKTLVSLIILTACGAAALTGCETDNPEKTYTVTVSWTGNGSAKAEPEETTSGTTVALTADPAEGWIFQRWVAVSGDVEFDDPLVSHTVFVMPAENVAVRAEFSEALPPIYKVLVDSDGNGSASADPSEAAEGMTVTLTATPNDGYLFDKWSVIEGDVTIDDPFAESTYFIMPAGNVEITARFEELDVFAFITDEVFLNYCRSFDTNGDGKLSLQEARLVKEISVVKINIASLAGIKYFTALETLDCKYNLLTSLDINANTALENLYCEYNQLSTLDVTKNKKLKILSCTSNQLSALNVDENKELTQLKCHYNRLTALEVSANTKLRTLYCYNNWMNVLDVSAMAFGDTGTYSVYCGHQTGVLTLTMREDQKPYWNSYLSKQYSNTNVVLAD